jgi:hypothetical protein
MKPRRPAVPLRTLVAPPEVFMVLGHSLSIGYVAQGRWTVSVDGAPVPGSFGSKVEAWEAGVRATGVQEQQRSA